MHDSVNRPAHYTSHPSGIECIQIAEHMTFSTGNAIKYLWRAGLKNPDCLADKAAIEDLRKAAWYIAREISRLELEVLDAREDDLARPTEPSLKPVCEACLGLGRVQVGYSSGHCGTCGGSGERT